MSETVGDFLLRRLTTWGVERIYGYPGDGINGILGSFSRADPGTVPTQGSANPALTIMALASRLAERLDLKRRDASAQRQRPRPRLLRPRRLSRAGAG